jgi:hypothetical protein
MKFLLFATFFIILHSNSFAYEEVNELPPKERSYMGEHNMVLVSQNSTIYALVMTTYVPPSNVQLLYKIENKDLALLQTVRDGRLTTIKTESFNLQTLMQDEKMVIMADVYAGHFARDGMLVYENIPLTFAKLVYFRELDEIEDSSNQQEYDVIDLKKSYKIYIHKIQRAPSFAHMLHIDLEAGCLTRFRNHRLYQKKMNCYTSF